MPNRRCDLILTSLAGFLPGGAYHLGPKQAQEDPGAGDEHSITNALRIMVLEDLRVQILCSEER